MFGLFKRKKKTDVPVLDQVVKSGDDHRNKRVEDKVTPASQHVSGGQPRGVVLMRFKALETFKCRENNSVYVQGYEYTVRVGNSQLEKLVLEWQKQKKVKIK